MIIYSRQNPPTGFYIYAYVRKDGTPYYIGKGSNGRAWSHNHNINLPRNKSNIIIMESDLTEIGALALERRYIRWYGRKDNGTGILRNLTDGGEGVEGRKGELSSRFGVGHSNETKQILRKIALNRNLVGENNPMFGRTHTEESKQKIRIKRSTQTVWNKGCVGIYTEETIQKMRKPKEKVHCSTCDKWMSKANYHKWNHHLH